MSSVIAYSYYHMDYNTVKTSGKIVLKYYTIILMKFYNIVQ